MSFLRECGAGAYSIGSMKMTKSLLLVSYHYPPVLSAGVSRMIGITRYLASHGWDITVVTVERAYAEHSDGATLDLIPDTVRVVRTGTLEIDRFNPRRLLENRLKLEAPGPGAFRSGRGLLAKLLRYPYALVHPLGCYPERQAGWNQPLFGVLKRLLDDDRYDVVMSSSPPHSSHLPLLVLKRMRHFRWVADFRDPWSAPPHYGKSSPMLAVTRRMEKSVLSACDHVIANTDGNREALIAAFPSVEDSKITVVTNGFDTGETIGQVSPGALDCDLIYTGEVYEGMLDLYLRAIALLRERNYEPLPRLFLYGYIDERSVRKIAENGLEESIVFKGRVGREQSLALMKSARALLLAVPHNLRGASWVPSKLYAYLFSNRPVLAIVPAGDAADLIAQTGTGTAITSTDPEQVASDIGGFIDAVRNQSLALKRNERIIARYTMESIGERIERVLAKQAEKSQ